MSTVDGDFISNNETEPNLSAATGVGDFNIKVFLNGIEQGWFTDAGSPEYWISVTPKRADSTVWSQVTHRGFTYLKKSTNNYLSYRSADVVFTDGLKMRDWFSAAKWQLSGKNLKCLDNDSLVGREGDGFYVNNANVVEVEFVPA